MELNDAITAVQRFFCNVFSTCHLEPVMARGTTIPCIADKAGILSVSFGVDLNFWNGVWILFTELQLFPDLQSLRIRFGISDFESFRMIMLLFGRIAVNSWSEFFFENASERNKILSVTLHQRWLVIFRLYLLHNAFMEMLLLAHHYKNVISVIMAQLCATCFGCCGSSKATTARRKSRNYYPFW